MIHSFQHNGWLLLQNEHFLFQIAMDKVDGWAGVSQREVTLLLGPDPTFITKKSVLATMAGHYIF